MAIRYTDIRIDGSSVKDLPDGSIKVTAQLTRTGIFEYRNPDGSLRREYRSAEEVFSDRSRETFAGSPVTINHPRFADGSRLVSPASWKNVAVGHVGDTIRQDGEYAVADIYIRDADAVAKVKKGELRHVSCGYRVDYDPTPGVTSDGQRFDGAQKNIIGNHLALLPSGVPPRGGEGCALRLDSNGDELNSDVEELEKLKAQVSALTGELAKARTDSADIATVRKDLADAQAKIAALSEQLAPARIDALVTERAELLETAKANGVEAKGSNVEIKRAIVSKRTPDLKDRVDAMDDGALDVVLAVYKTLPHPTLGAVLPGAKTTDGAPRTDAAPALPKISDVAAKFAKASQDAWKTSKGDMA